MRRNRKATASTSSGNWTARAMFVLAVALVALGAWIAESRAAEPATNDSSVRVFFTGDTKGYIHPCGCATGLKGGLPRRATYLARARRDGDLLIDLGNVIEGVRPQDRIRLRYVLKSLKLLRYDALVPGPGELAYGEDFEKMVRDAGLRVLCANLQRRDGERLFAAWHVHATPNGQKIGIVGLTSPYQKLPERYNVTEPAVALKRALAGLRAQGVTNVIAAGYLKGKPALDLARDFPEVTLVAVGFVPRGTKSPIRRGGAPVVLAGERGQYVVSAQLAGIKVVGGEQAWLGEEVPDDKTLAALVRKHDEEVSSMGSAYKAAQLLAFRKQGWVGSESCRECHKQEYESWAKSKHAHAMETLRGKNQDRNPNCLECHYQDSQRRGEAPRQLVKGVGCESCHGGGAKHVEYWQQHSGRSRSVRHFAAARSCDECHDAENSPTFERSRFWKGISHGG